MLRRREHWRSLTGYALWALGFFCISALVVGVSLRVWRPAEQHGRDEPGAREQVRSLQPTGRGTARPAAPIAIGAAAGAPQNDEQRRGLKASLEGSKALDVNPSSVLSAPQASAADMTVPGAETAAPRVASPAAQRATLARRVSPPAAHVAVPTQRAPVIQSIDDEAATSPGAVPRQAPRVRVIHMTTAKIKVIE